MGEASSATRAAAEASLFAGRCEWSPAMNAQDRERWNDRYGRAEGTAAPDVPSGFAAVVALLPTEGIALDLACGRGDGTMWLAQRGLSVLGVDASDVAIELASAASVVLDAAARSRCAFSVHDLDLGLPAGPPVALITCHLFNDASLDRAMLDRLEPGGVLALCVLSEVGAEPGPFRVGRNEMLERFDGNQILAHHERNGSTTIVVRAAGPEASGRLD